MTRIILLTLILGTILLAAVYLLTPRADIDVSRPASGEYLDAHAHIAGIGAGGSGCYVHPDLMDSYKFTYYMNGFGVSVDELKTHGDELIARRMNRRIRESVFVKSAVILALDGVVRDDKLDKSATQVFVPNEFVAEMARKYPHLKFGASVHPERSDWRKRLVKAKQDGAVLMKWLPAIMDIDPSNTGYIPYYRALVEHDLPLLVHVGKERAFRHANDALGDPRKLTLPLEHGVTVIAAHAATTGEYGSRPSHELLLSMFQEYPKLYADISSLTQINKVGYLVELLNTPGVKERLLYGSDWPLQLFPVVSSYFHWPDIPLAQAKSIEAIDNKWDRDVALKRALGVPPSVFGRSLQLLSR